MSFSNDNGAGSHAVSSAYVTKDYEMTIGTDPIRSSIPLLTGGMPRVFFYLLQTAGAVGSEVIPEFATQQDDEGDMKWLPLASPVITPLNVPIILSYNLPTKFIRVSVTRPSGQATTMQINLMAGQ